MRPRGPRASTCLVSRTFGHAHCEAIGSSSARRRVTGSTGPSGPSPSGVSSIDTRRSPGSTRCSPGNSAATTATMGSPGTRWRSHGSATKCAVGGGSGWIAEADGRPCRGLTFIGSRNAIRSPQPSPSTPATVGQQIPDLRSRMRQSRTSGSVGAPGGRLPGATRPPSPTSSCRSAGRVSLRRDPAHRSRARLLTRHGAQGGGGRRSPAGGAAVSPRVKCWTCDRPPSRARRPPRGASPADAPPGGSSRPRYWNVHRLR